MANLYYYNKFQDKLVLVKERVENTECINRIIDFYYDTSMDVFYGNVEQVMEEKDISNFPNGVEKAYYVEVESKETDYFVFLTAMPTFAKYYSSLPVVSFDF